jgi:hypothetical protein
MRRSTTLAALGLLASLVVSAPARAWHGKGHHAATELAVAAARAKLPGFFSAGAATVAHCSLDPDLFTRPIGPPALHAAEASEHYFDLELLKGKGDEPPATRYEFVALCARHGLKPEKVGLLPYAVTEWTQRLAVAFAEHRAYPGNPHVRSKCLVLAGVLSHYAQDLCQPLHATIHWDGRAKPDGSSPRTGIHTRVDALLGKLDRRKVRREALDGLEVRPLGELMREVMAEIRRSNALVDRVYDLDRAIPKLDAPLDADSSAGRFAVERLRAAVGFTASLYVTAWADSAKIRAKLPSWYCRPYFPPPAAGAASRPAPPARTTLRWRRVSSAGRR